MEPLRGARITPLVSADAHALHAYFNACPESPDGRWVLLFVSRRADAHVGDVCLLERATGSMRALAEGATVEDAHRQAYQQWARGGECVVYQDLRDDCWVISAVEVATGERRELCEGRQLGWGRADLDFVPLHGLHWAPGEHRDLELLDVRSGEITVAVRLEDAAGVATAELRERLGGEAASIFFPVVSPDGRRVIFKLSRPDSGVFRDPRASRREGLFAWDLAEGRMLHVRDAWGHPAWHPDSRRVITTPSMAIDVETGSERTIEGLEPLRGSHPSFSPDGRVLVSDFADEAGRWGVAVAGPDAPRWRVLHLAAAPGPGTASWRPPHPHPALSAEGRRVYLNVNLGAWCVCHVAELPGM